MKICQVLAGNEDGGLEKHTIELSIQLVNKGFDVTVIAHKDFAESFENIKFIPPKHRPAPPVNPVAETILYLSKTLD